MYQPISQFIYVSKINTKEGVNDGKTILENITIPYQSIKILLRIY